MRPRGFRTMVVSESMKLLCVEMGKRVSAGIHPAPGLAARYCAYS